MIYRLGLASTRAQARQFVSHGHVEVDGLRVTIPSCLVTEGQAVAIAADSPVRPLATDAADLTGTIPAWLEADVEGLRGRMLRPPRRTEITVPVDEHLIIEFYARR